jgi:predicted  nucleic acid-binding Zn-ribbon protein
MASRAKRQREEADRSADSDTVSASELPTQPLSVHADAVQVKTIVIKNRQAVLAAQSYRHQLRRLAREASADRGLARTLTEVLEGVSASWGEAEQDLARLAEGLGQAVDKLGGGPVGSSWQGLLTDLLRGELPAELDAALPPIPESLASKLALEDQDAGLASSSSPSTSSLIERLRSRTAQFRRLAGLCLTLSAASGRDSGESLARDLSQWRLRAERAEHRNREMERLAAEMQQELHAAQRRLRRTSLDLLRAAGEHESSLAVARSLAGLGKNRDTPQDAAVSAAWKELGGKPDIPAPAPAPAVAAPATSSEEVAELRRKLDEAQLSLQELEDEAGVMTEAMQASEEERQRAVEELAVAQGELARLRAQAASNEAVLGSALYAECEARCQAAERERAILEAELGALRSVDDDRVVSLARAERAVADAVATSSALFERRIADTEHRLRESLTQLDEAQAKLAYVAEDAKQLSSLRRSLEHSRAEVKAAQARLDAVGNRGERGSLQAALTNKAVAEHVGKLEAKLTSLQEVLASTEGALQAARSVSRDEERNARISASLEALAGGEHGALAKQVEELRLENGRLTVSVETARKQAISKSQKLDAAGVEVTRLRAEVASCKADIEGLTSELGEALDEVESAADSRKASMDDLMAKDAKIQSQLVELAKMRQEASIHRQRADDSMRAAKELGAAVESIRGELSQSVSQREDLFRQLEQLQRENLVLGEQRDALRSGAEAPHASETDLKALREQLAAAAASGEESAASLVRTSAELSNCQGEVGRLRERLSRARERARKAGLPDEDAAGPPSLRRASSAPIAGSGDTDQRLLQYYRSAVRCRVKPDQEKDRAIKGCGHCFSKAAVDELVAARNRKCPVCGQRFAPEDVIPIFLSA